MASIEQRNRADEHRDVPFASDDPVLSALDRAEAEYRKVRDGKERLDGELRQARDRLGKAAAEERRLSDEVAAGQQRTEEQQRLAERHRERAKQLEHALKDIHRAIFSGNVYQLILKACLTLTGATRGLYVTVRDQDKFLRIRAAVDVDGYPQSPPSERIKAMCFAALKERNSLVRNSEADDAKLPDLPAPATPGETFRNWVAAPVVLLKGLDGVLIAADKTNGDFDEDDVEALLSVGDQAAVAVENARLRQDLQGAYLSTITALADAVEAKDAYIAGHCERVARYAHRIAEALDLSPHDRSVVFCAALLHDVGKIGVSDGVLNKPGALLPEERELVRSHVRVGYDLVRKVPLLETVADAVLRHHEWYDGSGYPDGLKGDEIPFTARIVSVADAYGAMIDKRSYKEPFTNERARDELARCAGIQFDPRVVEAFLSVLDGSGLDDHDYEDEMGYAPLLGLGMMSAS